MALRSKPKLGAGTDRAEAFLAKAPDYRPDAGKMPGFGPRMKGNRQVVTHTFMPDLLARLDAYAEASGQTRAAVINRAVHDLLKKEGTA